MGNHGTREVTVNLDHSVPLLISVAGWFLVLTAVCVRCSAGGHHRFQDEYAPGAAANAAEESLDVQEKTSASLLLLGLGSLVLILQAIHQLRSLPAPASPAEPRQEP